MRRALSLAERAFGRTAPNPLVGAVLVKDGEIVGEGYHRRAGMPHAEVEALRDAGEAARGATAYVTLEPCSHFGRTPPCTHALIDAGVREVVYAAGDPNPLVSGRGVEQLRAAGVAVRNSICHDEATALNRPFFKFIQTKMPFITAKFGMTLDGKIATASGDSKWITNAAAREQGHRLRNVSDAIVVGVGTVLADDPSLTTRLSDTSDVRHPVRVVVDTHARTPVSAKLVSGGLPGRTVLAATEKADESNLDALRAHGVEVWVLPLDSAERVDLTALLHKLGENELVNVMVEGGGTLLGSLLELGQIDRVWAFIAPKIVGGIDAPTPFGGAGIGRLSEAYNLEITSVKQLDGDIWIEGEKKRG